MGSLSLLQWIFPAQELNWGLLHCRQILYQLSYQGRLPNPGTEPRSPTLQEDSFPAEPQGKPKNTGVGSPSLLQGIFPTQELNRGLLHCRQILYQLRYEGSPGDGGQAEISVTPDVDGMHIRIFGSS